jgi:fructose 1,6-bisphosphatase
MWILEIESRSTERVVVFLTDKASHQPTRLQLFYILSGTFLSDGIV